MRRFNKFKNVIYLIVIFALNSFIAYADIPLKGTNNNNNNNNIVLSPNAADCVIPSGNTYLTVNNVRCRINTGGDMWWDLSGSARYEIPKGSLKHSMFSGSLWIAGVDENGQNLRVAAVVHRGSTNSVIDYWPGPLSIDGTASIDKALCKKYDRFFKISKSEVEKFVATQEITDNIKNYPGNGENLPNQSFFLAPFFDADGDFIYDPTKGDYPYYDLKNVLCSKDGKKPTAEESFYTGNTSSNLVKIKGTSIADQVLKGDETIWWVFNDKGNIHSQSKGIPIGMEIRAQAFGFSTSDEINNMTFYSYELINRSSIALYDTYFSQWVDCDLGYGYDDFVGCDVARGLGYCYNGLPVDGTGKFDEYGANPPAIGVDYFQGPYMNADGLDNPKGLDSTGNFICDASINGVNFGDSVIDNERLGMQRFIYHNNGGVPNCSDPNEAIHFYNYLRGKWKDGTSMVYGGNGYLTNTCAGNIEARFMFPGTTDPCNWGTNGVDPMPACNNKIWSEKEYGNAPADRRIMQSSGPFKLESGAVNYITVGIPWARAANQGGDPYQSVLLLQYVDDKAQRLFDNCFRVINGPDAPILISNEYDREIVLYLDNEKGVSNNFKVKPEDYTEWDYNIITPPTEPKNRDSLYRFEGYQIFQLKDESVSSSDLWDINKARVVAQCDLQNFKADRSPIGRLLNYNFIPELNSYVGQEMVNGSNKGIVHSFRIFKDLFASGSDNKLVNHKKYYYIAIAYAFNEYFPYSQNPQVSGGLIGQQKPYLSGRKTPNGPIKSITCVPHKLVGDVVLNCNIGEFPIVSRIEGQGNGGNVVDITDETVERILTNSSNKTLDYVKGTSPINIKIIDPLKVVDGVFDIKFVTNKNLIDSCYWAITDVNTGNLIAKSYSSISMPNEQILINYGISINISNIENIANTDGVFRNEVVLESSISFEDSIHQWLKGFKDIDGDNNVRNWIRSGTEDDKEKFDRHWSISALGKKKLFFLDENSQFEKINGGTWAPYRLTTRSESENLFTGPSIPGFVIANVNTENLSGTAAADRNLTKISSIDVVLTKDKTKWTKCVVVETGSYNTYKAAKQFYLRKSPSKDIDGNVYSDTTIIGRSWFPGYAINVETGERLNIIFGEDSRLVQENGRDMIWNPTHNSDDTAIGGKHYIYIMGHYGSTVDDCPAYDEGEWIYNKLKTIKPADLKSVFKDAMWVNMPLLKKGEQLLNNKVKIRIRIAKPYAKYFSLGQDSIVNHSNNNFPYYRFKFSGMMSSISNEKAENALDLINVVPNPYFAYSSYEFDQLDNRIKITNLPKKCTVKIYNLSGTMVREFTKDDESSYSIEWDLKNKAGLKVSSGMYLIHVKADGIGERIVKWYGVIRPTDLNSF